MPAPRNSKAAAATKEVAGGSKPHTITWRGIDLELPAQLGADAAWAMADVEAAERSGTKGFGPILAFLTSMLGDEQVHKVRAKLREDQIPLDGFVDVVQELLVECFKAYGMAEGESVASE